MSLQIGMTTRRAFLERSMLGFGSAFLLPSLLTSCMTDHMIPDPDPKPPLLDDDDSQIHWNDDAKAAVVTALQLVPDVGGFVGALVDIFWPTPGDGVWSQVRAQVEALIDQKIDDEVFKTVQGNLNGLEGLISTYRNALNPKDEYGNSIPVNYETIIMAWNAVNNAFTQYQPNFQLSGDEVLLLPLWAQFANMYLGILRDAVLFGPSWNLDQVTLQRAITQLKSFPDTFKTYTTKWYQEGQDNILKNVQQDNFHNEPFKSVNTYDRQMTQTVLDYMDTWQYFDVTQHPNGAKNPDGTNINLLTREIYSDPYGNTYRNDGILQGSPIVLPAPPTQFPTQITVWSGNRIDAVQLTYPANSGPGKVTTTARMGDQNGGSNQRPHGGTFPISTDNLIVQAQISYEDTAGNLDAYAQAIDTIWFVYNSGPPTPRMGGDLGPRKSGVVGYINYALSSVYIHGVNAYYRNSADCIVFGFMNWNPPKATLRALRSIYVSSPQEHSVADFARQFPKLGITSDLITDELKAARKKHWENIAARAKGPK